MADRILRFFASLKLTVVCLVAAMILVFVGTMAQVHEGLYAAQNRYFRSLVVFWTPPNLPLKIPVFPGGYLVGGLLLINLTASFLTRFSLKKETIGLQMTHGGIILLLAGQFATDWLQVESHMRLREGEAKNYSEDSRRYELAIIDTTPGETAKVIAIPERLLANQKEIQNPALPFAIKIRQYWPNSRLSQIETNTPGTPSSSRGFGQAIAVRGVPAAIKMDERNLPSVVLELAGPQESGGTWLASAMLEDPQTFQAGNRSYQLVMRLARYYNPFFIELKKFSHDKYIGTDIPKNFSSRVRLINKSSGEDREVLIYMNNPLRYGGQTFYQASYDKNDPKVTILQVVRNPGWLTPYVSCALVALGLLIQFMSHLMGFIKERKSA
jgi:hypothetical protein